jgi:hypothetical protein
MVESILSTLSYKKAVLFPETNCNATGLWRICFSIKAKNGDQNSAYMYMQESHIRLEVRVKI